MVPVLQKGDLPIDNTTSYPPQIYPQQIEDINNSKYLHEHRPKELIPKVFQKRSESGHDIALNNMGMQSRDKSTHTFHQKEKVSGQISEHGPSRNRLRHEKIFARQSRLPDDTDEEEDYAHRSSSTSNDGHSPDGGSDSGPIDFSLFTRNSQDKDDGKKHKTKSQNAPRRQPKFKHLYASSDDSDASENSDTVMSAVQKSHTSNDKSIELSGQRNAAEMESDSNTTSTRPSNSQKRRPGRPRKDDLSAIASKLGDNSDTDDSVSSRRRERQTTSDSTASKNKSGATDPNRTDKAGRTRLFSCTGAGNLERVKELIQKGAYVNWRDNAGWTPLHEAALKGQAEVAKYLLSCGAEVNAQGFGNDTPLHDACSNGFSECVQILVDHSANINIQNSDGQRPIDVCEDEDCLDILNKKQKQIDRLATRDKAGRTSLHRACIAGQFDEVLSLIKSGSDVNAKDNASWTPLHEASLNGYLDIVKALCEHGADINPMGYDGSTPLHEASENGHVKLVRYLLEINADKNIQNKKGQTAVQVCDDKSIEDLFSADVKSHHAAPLEETTKRSTSHTSLTNQVEPDNKAPTAKKTLSREEKKIQALMQTFQKMEKRQAKKTKRRQHRPHDEDDEDEEEEEEEESTSAPPKESEQLQRTKRLVRGRPRSTSLSQSREASEEAAQPKKPVMKLDPKRKDTAGRTQLHKWAVRGDASTVRELLEAGANSNERDHAGWTPLHEAALRGRLEVLKLLLQHGADPNALGADQDTPLHDAVENGHGDIVRVLLAHGANVYARNAADLDSLQIARDNADDDMVAILKSAQKLNSVAPPVRQPKPEPVSEQDDTTLKASKSVVSGMLAVLSSQPLMFVNLVTILTPVSPYSFLYIRPCCIGQENV
jgi:ankyrin repeat protein